jgi:2-C-methyl-D-erythritol 4-phosphate cytidylyltransferase|tara:strand:+ start:818 stop:1231 length:414 start_codon:yes stop_codon:yes gene_type:complete
MEYNFLLLENNKLSIKNNGEFLSLNKENLISLDAAYSLISTYEIKDENSLSSKVLELLENNKVVINFEKVSSALKELEDNKIIAHLNREKFRKISFPIFVQSEYLINYLKISGLKFELSSFLDNSNFKMLELDSLYR